MNRRLASCSAIALGVVVIAVTIAAQEKQPARTQKPPVARESMRAADEEAIRKQAREFVEAFAKGDAKAIAAGWTEQAEYNEEGGATLRGRAAIEQAYSSLFQEHPGTKLEAQIESIRFPSRDTAIEEGILLLKYPGPELPSSSRYSVLHVREDGQWRTAIAREWGSAEDRLHDLAWLIGDWIARSKDSEVRLSYAWNEAKSCIEGKFTTQEQGRPSSSGSQRIMRDPQSGNLHSWIFDDTGGHGQADWVRDGNRWVLDTVGVAADGTPTTATNVLTRINDDEYLWRSVERTAGGSELPHTNPVKITRIKSGK